MNANKPTILIGPEPSKNPTNSGSWKWFGIDLANELKKYYNIITQKNAEPLKKADCYLVVKNIDYLDKVRKNKQKSIFLAVDSIKSEDDFLGTKCDWFIVNNQEFFEDYFKPERASFIPHHIKYFIDGHRWEARLKYILWQGMEGNYRYVKKYLDEHHIDCYIRFLLSGKERDAGKSWEHLDYQDCSSVRRHFGWSEERQRNELRYCSGFLDIKGDDFHQRYKPATKVLDALASGVPTAINDCGVRRYMETLGIDLAYPTDTEKWFSRDYFDYTQGLKWRIREEFNVEVIAKKYKEVIDKVLEN